MVKKMKGNADKEITSDELFLIMKGLYGQFQFLSKKIELLLITNSKMAEDLIKLSNFCLGIDMALRGKGILDPKEIEEACRTVDEIERQKKKPKLHIVPRKN